MDQHQLFTTRGFVRDITKPGAEDTDKQILFIASQEVTLHQANNTENIYCCVLEMRTIFTVSADETSAAALRSCLSGAVKDSHRAGTCSWLPVSPLKYTIAST